MNIYVASIIFYLLNITLPEEILVDLCETKLSDMNLVFLSQIIWKVIEDI